MAAYSGDSIVLSMLLESRANPNLQVREDLTQNTIIDEQFLRRSMV